MRVRHRVAVVCGQGVSSLVCFVTTLAVPCSRKHHAGLGGDALVPIAVVHFNKTSCKHSPGNSVPPRCLSWTNHSRVTQPAFRTNTPAVVYGRSCDGVPRLDRHLFVASATYSVHQDGICSALHTSIFPSSASGAFHFLWTFS